MSCRMATCCISNLMSEFDILRFDFNCDLGRMILKKFLGYFAFAAAVISPAIAQDGGATAKDEFTIYFDRDSTVITPAGKSLIKAKVDKYVSNPNHFFYVQGHTDTRLRKDESLLHSAKTAGQIYQYLIELKVPANNITTVALGETAPAKRTLDGVSEPLNRRVAIKVFLIPPKK